MGPSHPPHAVGLISSDFSMVFLRSFCGLPTFFNLFLVVPSFGLPMVFLQFSKLFSAVCLWFSNFSLMLSCGFSHGFPLVSLRFSCGFPIVFLWFPSGSPMVFICFAWAAATSPLRSERGTPAVLTSAQTTRRWT